MKASKQRFSIEMLRTVLAQARGSNRKATAAGVRLPPAREFFDYPEPEEF